MFKLWVKFYSDEKIVKQFVYFREEKFTYSHFFDYLCEIAHEADSATPVLLKTHLFNLAKYRYVKFIPRDFVESVSFDYMIVEILST